MTIFAIDPGPEKSAVVWFNPIEFKYLRGYIANNREVLTLLKAAEEIPIIACEWITSYGIAVGESVFETCYWVGKFDEAVQPRKFLRIPRADIKIELCHSARAKDPNIRQVLIDMFPKTGGGKTPQIGVKKQPGPLYGISSHMWSALAVAVVATKGEKWSILTPGSSTRNGSTT